MTAPAEPGRTQGRGAEKGRATRAALVELAADLFAEKGYVQTSIRDISRRGSVTSGAIYGHFRNKADLLAEAISARTSEELVAQSPGLDAGDADYVETLTRLARDYPRRRRLRALLVQGAAAAQTDEETRTRLREEQLEYLAGWLEAYERERERMGIHPTVDVQAALLYTWAVELGLGVLESVGITPASKEGWADIQNRLARSLRLPAEELAAPVTATPKKRPARKQAPATRAPAEQGDDAPERTRRRASRGGAARR
ncbi:MAG: TetR/AcrR family transcriptional regulator [Acidimicrobiales bacterium]|jgi:TetR/AcrR family acrAB operon transcriptional repressor|nr:TetR/AcrR family transcriptional regulator [Acidimicrobiales bacterium]